MVRLEDNSNDEDAYIKIQYISFCNKKNVVVMVRLEDNSDDENAYKKNFQK